MSAPSDSIRQGLLKKLEDLKRAGVTHLGNNAEALVLAATSDDEASTIAEEAVPAREALAPRDAAPPQKVEEMESPQSPPANDTLEVIQAEVAACTRCDELASTRTQTVFGIGNPNARLCFLGEAPGADEDRTGEPFVGRSGKKLTEIIEKGMGLSRDDVFILNILKCRPPGNRNPAPAESENCRGFLDRQLAMIQPEFICCLGAVAAHNLLQTNTPIGKMRGQFYDYRGVRVMCTYHPAYLLRNPPIRTEVWKDIQFLMSEMGIERASK